jgi:hypothetical protein
VVFPIVSRGVASAEVTPGVVESFGWTLELSALGEGRHPNVTAISNNNIANINLAITISFSVKGHYIEKTSQLACQLGQPT